LPITEKVIYAFINTYMIDMCSHNREKSSSKKENFLKKHSHRI